MSSVWSVWSRVVRVVRVARVVRVVPVCVPGLVIREVSSMTSMDSIPVFRYLPSQLVVWIRAYTHIFRPEELSST
jgi:hypothetical protein